MEQGGKSVAVATDLGKYDSYTVECLRNLDAVLLEANHDIHMLEVGGYPYYLKQRILGDRGHLSNELSGRLLCDILHDNLKPVSYTHLMTVLYRILFVIWEILFSYEVTWNLFC